MYKGNGRTDEREEKSQVDSLANTSCLRIVVFSHRGLLQK